jgi:hypothetical protein
MEFKLLNKNVCMTGGKIGSFKVAPKRLVEVFGKPNKEDDEKLSGSYYFEGEDGCIVRFYDWKSTNRFAPGLLSPKQFWALEYPHEFSLGSDDRKNAEPFFEWLHRQLEITHVTYQYPHNQAKQS